MALARVVTFEGVDGDRIRQMKSEIEGGEHGPCGWLKYRFGLSWQVVPKRLPELLSDPDRETAQRVMAAMLKMGKIEVAELEQAAVSA